MRRLPSAPVIARPILLLLLFAVGIASCADTGILDSSKFVEGSTSGSGTDAPSDESGSNEAAKGKSPDRWWKLAGLILVMIVCEVVKAHDDENATIWRVLRLESFRDTMRGVVRGQGIKVPERYAEKGEPSEAKADSTARDESSEVNPDSAATPVGAVSTDVHAGCAPAPQASTAAESSSQVLKCDVLDEEIRATLKAAEPEDYYPDQPSLAQVKLAILAGRTVCERFYFGPQGPSALDSSMRERFDYIQKIFGSGKAGLVHWLEKRAACGSPDAICPHTSDEVHLVFCKEPREIAIWVRAGWSEVSSGALPERLREMLPPSHLGF